LKLEKSDQDKKKRTIDQVCKLIQRDFENFLEDKNSNITIRDHLSLLYDLAFNSGEVQGTQGMYEKMQKAIGEDKSSNV